MKRPAAADKTAPPPLPANKGAGKNTPIKLNPSVTEKGSPNESIFSEVPEVDPTPKDWKLLHPGELEPGVGAPQSLEAFSRSQEGSVKLASPESPAATSSASTTPLPLQSQTANQAASVSTQGTEAVAQPPAIKLLVAEPVGAPVVSPTFLQPAVVLSKPAAMVEAKSPSRPPPLPVEKPAASAVQLAPRLWESEPALKVEKLPPPSLLPVEQRKEEKPIVVDSKRPDAEEKGILHKAPHLISSEPPAVVSAPPVVSAKAPATGPVSKATGPILLRDIPITGTAAPTAKPVSAAALPPIEVKNSPLSANAPSSKAAEARPALKPAVLPNKTLVTPKPAEVMPQNIPVETGTKPSPIAPATQKGPLPLTRLERARKRRLVEMVVFYGVLLLVGSLLYFGSLFFNRETRVEGQVIPPAGMPLGNEVWIVSDFRDSCAGIAEDLTEERAPLTQEIQERQDHVDHAQADIALREERIRLLAGQIQADKDELAGIGKQAREATQAIWDGPGAQLDTEYNQKLNDLQNAILDRAKSHKLDYQPDDTYHSPEVWANAYRLALYGVTTVDSAKELQWLDDQMKQWRDFLKSLDDRKEQLREQAAQITIAPAAKITDLTSKIEELQNRIDTTEAEEDPIKAELQQAQADLAQAQAADAGLDDKYYKELDAIPDKNISKRIPMQSNGRFSWVEEESSFAEGETEHHYLIFSRATRSDGRQYWALGWFTLAKDDKVDLLIEPDSFISTKAILRPNLPPEEQAQ